MCCYVSGYNADNYRYIELYSEITRGEMLCLYNYNDLTEFTMNFEGTIKTLTHTLVMLY